MKIDWKELEEDFKTPYRSESEKNDAEDELQGEFVLLAITFYAFYVFVL